MRLFRRRSGHREDSVRYIHAPTRRQLLRASAGALPLALGAGRASAQAAYPSRPVKVVIPYPPAGGADTVGRILFQKLGEMWGARSSWSTIAAAPAALSPRRWWRRRSTTATPSCTTPPPSR